METKLYHVEYHAVLFGYRFGTDKDSRITMKNLSRIRVAKIPGAVRKVRKGDWFLSGALPAAYYAMNDTNDVRQIMHLVLAEVKTQVIERVTHDLMPPTIY